MIHTHRLTFTGATGDELAARFDRPIGRLRATALFAHCFTCSKDIAAASRISRALASRGIGVLRFDFTGLGHSEGEFENTHFSSNVGDLVAAADALRGAEGALEDIERDGVGEVEIAGRRFRIRREMIDDLASQTLEGRLGTLKRALLVMHAPFDNIVGIDNASDIFLAAKHPKSFVSLDGADHLLGRRADAEYAADVIAGWVGRYLPADPRPTPDVEPHEVFIEEAGYGKFATDIQAGPHRLRADEPPSVGGDDSGPTPYGLLAAALGACTTMTLRMFADRKNWPLDHVSATVVHDKIHARDCEECETKTGRIDRFDRSLRIEGDALSEEQRARLLEIADRCPVHRTLHQEVEVRTRVAD